MEPPASMEHSNPHDDGTASEQASGPAAAFQDKMETWTDRVGYGAYRGLICGLYSALGLDVVLLVFRIAQAAITHSYGKHDTDTLGEMLVNLFLLALLLTVVITAAGVIVGAILGAAGIIRKKKSPSEPEKPESN